MKGFYSFLAFMCILAVSENGIEAMPSSDDAAAKLAMETAKIAFALSNEVMDLFTRMIDRVVPWQTLHDSINELDKFRSDYSQKAAHLVAEVKIHMLEGMDAYDQASKHVYVWCTVVEPMLQEYIGLFQNMNRTKSAQQKQVLVEMLDNGIEEMEKAQEMLGNSSLSFNEANGRLTTLRYQLGSDFNENSKYFANKIAEKRAEAYKIGIDYGLIDGLIAIGITALLIELLLIPKIKAEFKNAENFYDNLNIIVDQSFANIDETKHKLSNEIRAIGDLKIQTIEMNTYASIDSITALRDIVISSAKNLIDKCIAYRKKHRNSFT